MVCIHRYPSGMRRHIPVSVRQIDKPLISSSTSRNWSISNSRLMVSFFPPHVGAMVVVGMDYASTGCSWTVTTYANSYVSPFWPVTRTVLFRRGNRVFSVDRTYASDASLVVVASISTVLLAGAQAPFTLYIILYLLFRPVSGQCVCAQIPRIVVGAWVAHITLRHPCQHHFLKFLL